MNYHEFNEAKLTFRYTSILKDRKVIYQKREQFVKDFSLSRLKRMKLDDYIQGKGSSESFCYRVEWELDRLGRITGAPSYKFGIFYSKKYDEYKFVQKFGDTYKEAFSNVKNEIIKLLEAGSNTDFHAIESNKISNMFKGKILSIYYPEKYLNIFSEEHLDYYLNALDIDNENLMKKDPIYKRDALVDFKNQDYDMKKWSLDMFAMFLVTQYPKEPQSIKDEGFISNHLQELEFPTTDNYEFIDLDLCKNKRKGQFANFNVKGKIDYELDERIKTKMGDRGERIVLKAEIQRVADNRGISLKQAAKIVKRVSLKSDSFGYDILSANENGTPRYIEVKATSKCPGDMTFFYTANELQIAMQYPNDYYLYIVYEILSECPKIWCIKNPFVNDRYLELKPIKYMVRVTTKKD